MTNPFETQANLMTGMAAMWSTAVAAGITAMMANATRPWIGGDVNAPFGRNFSMDIDPVTSWFLPGLFGHARGSRQAEAFMELFAQQQLLICGLIEDCKAYETRDTAGRAQLSLSPTTLRQLEDVTDRLGRLARRGDAA
ncbi:MAG: hypothetical protein AAGF76_13755 [Pseudomonadota bacterium]